MPTTEGYGHIARAKAIIGELEKRGIAYGVLTDRKGEAFLKSNELRVEVDSTFHGISYCFKKSGNEKSLDPLMTVGKLLIDTPLYFRDYFKVLRHVLNDGYDVIVNDANLQITRIPIVNVLNILHYTLPQTSGDARRVFGGLQSLFYEGFIEPVINASSILTDRFCMDLRRARIDHEHIFPPIVSRTTKAAAHIRNELGLTAKDKLILDGRRNPPVGLYRRLGRDYRLNFLVRSAEQPDEHVRTMNFVPNMVDYVTAADLFITSAGFSSLSEGAVSGTRMLIDPPEFHFEGLKNLVIAEREGYGRRVDCLPEDILREIEDRRRRAPLENGLPYVIEMLQRLSYDRPLLQALVRYA